MSRGLGRTQRAVLELVVELQTPQPARRICASLERGAAMGWHPWPEDAWWPEAPAETSAQTRSHAVSVRRALQGLVTRGLLLDSSRSFPLPDMERVYGTADAFGSLLDALERRSEDERFQERVQEWRVLLDDVRRDGGRTSLASRCAARSRPGTLLPVKGAARRP